MSRGSRGEQARFGLELAPRDLLQLELAQRRRVFTPAGNAALLDAERCREERLRFVVLDGFCRGHIEA